ncbi:MAG: formylglycine-generating enzyme family protein, partial [Candidatus Coatesbacteria bacterium]|nr:formylglycine-generating enzyme family protein [Candidatus Coatesbacteria bacterium]
GFVLPDGTILYYLDDHFDLVPTRWRPAFMPEGFSIGPVEVISLTVPEGLEEGSYLFASAITAEGEPDFLSISWVEFVVEEQQPPLITMVPVPAGAFLMGSSIWESGHNVDEGPQRTVNVSAFEMSETEITQYVWEDVMRWNGSYYSGDDLPVEEVTWFDCVSFCNELSREHGYAECYTISNIAYDGNHIVSAEVSCDFDPDGYRLPTEAEWEYACRAETNTRYYNGNIDAELSIVAWFQENSGDVTHPVGQKEPNSWGLYDMHGNVWEWCWDWYDSGYYAAQPDPDTDPTGSANGSERILRGGSKIDDAWICRSAYRNSSGPSYQWSNVGFRIVRSMR